jgi:hypothetical protein
MSDLSTAYAALVVLRAFLDFFGLFISTLTLFELDYLAILCFIAHAATMVLIGLESFAAYHSFSRRLHDRRKWTRFNILLSLVGVLTALAAAILDGIYFEFDGEFINLMIETPTILLVVVSVACVFTLPALRIRHWATIATDQYEPLLDNYWTPELLPNDAAADEDEPGPLAAAYRLQVQERPDLEYRGAESSGEQCQSHIHPQRPLSDGRIPCG